ncbi:cytochrome P450 [Gloeopeniophorella convolvens]|nr:cytochrome P450 [Gloeopeniophorella convolvens]
MLTRFTVVDCLAFLLSAYIFSALWDHRRRRGVPYPPGPRAWPIIGNMFDVPKRSAWASYAEMSKKYASGDVIYLQIFGQAVVVLCSAQAVKDVLEKRGEVHSDRPTLPILEILKLDWMLPNINRSELWKDGRRLLDRSLRPSAITTSYQQMIEEQTRLFLGKLLVTPQGFREHIELLQGKLIMALTYGYDLKAPDDEMILAPIEINNTLSKLVLPGAVLVNTLPFLRHIPSWVPWFSYEPLARKGRDMSQRTLNKPVYFVKNAMRDGTAVLSLTSEALRDLDQLDPEERQKQEASVKCTFGSMFAGKSGSDTTVSALTWFFLALTLHLNVQTRAQAELNAVIGRERLPTLDDRPRLPYVEAICKEVMRWQMVTPMGLPHASSEDDVYKGFFIPKGSIIIANAWAILHDPEVYPDPDTFMPERFLNADGTVRDDPALSLAFGVGKRICPGRHFVDATIFVVVASVLSVFRVKKAKDDLGREIDVKVATVDENGIIMHSSAFECSITPRDQVAEGLITANSLA